MENVQEFLQEWEKKNNPFYPNEMRWDRVKINQMLAEYEAQKQVKNNLVLADVSGQLCRCGNPIGRTECDDCLDNRIIRDLES